MSNRYKKDSYFSEKKFREIVKLFSLDIPAMTVAGVASIYRQAMQTLYTQLRFRLAGEIEVDESYFGSRRIRGNEVAEQVDKFRSCGRIGEGNGSLSAWSKIALEQNRYRLSKDSFSKKATFTPIVGRLMTEFYEGLQTPSYTSS